MNLNDPRTILVVDDHQIVREGVRSLLTALRPSWTIFEAGSGTQAVEAMRQGAPDLAIIDITMPDESGFEVTSRLRTSGFDRPILIFTMHQSAQLGSDVKQAGAQGYVLKAQATEDLIRAVDILLGGGTFFGGMPEPETSPSNPAPGTVMFFRGLALGFV
ncbi:MAG TPA: response regulator transcription factor [Candidatus Acidoferrales bacterium]|nr:response regulator transcription factor [Candidatus Acidoferrales bacterium]